MVNCKNKGLSALVTNDDGYDSPGLGLLAEVACEVFEKVAVVAPDAPRSGVSHALSLNTPMKLNQLRNNFYSMAGTPADCVFFAMNSLLDFTPSFVLSGINIGPNVGFDTLYSGTVAGALEGILNGARAVAFSYASLCPADIELSKKFVLTVLDQIIGLEPLPGWMFNINYPAPANFGQLRGVRACRLGKRVFVNHTATWTDPLGQNFAWVGGKELFLEGEKNTDCWSLSQGYATIVPLTWDRCGAEMADQAMEYAKQLASKVEERL